jgi:hypothetical protein
MSSVWQIIAEHFINVYKLSGKSVNFTDLT